MAAASVAHLLSCNLVNSVPAEATSRLSASTSLGCPSIRVLAPKNKGLSLSPRLRILPKVKAKKQMFSSFDELLEKSEKPVLVDFYATCIPEKYLEHGGRIFLLCGPCQFMVPILEEVSAKLGDKIQVVKINTEKYTAIANRYSIEALPTFIVFCDGKPRDRFEGALPANELIERIEKLLQVSK